MAEAEYYNWKGMVHAKFNIAWKMRRYQNEITQWFNILNFFHIAPTPNTAAHLPPPTDQSTNLDLPTGPGTSFHPKSTSANPYTDQLWPHPHVYLHCGLHLQLPSLLQKAKLQQGYQQTIAECSGTSLQLFHCMLPRLHLFGESQDLPSDPLRREALRLLSVLQAFPSLWCINQTLSDPYGRETLHLCWLWENYKKMWGA